MRAAVLVTAVRTLGQGVVARARALATSGPSSQSAPRTAMSAWGPAEEVDEGVERHGADWQGIKEPYQLELTPSMGAIRPWGHHAIRMKDAFWPWMAASCWRIQMHVWGESYTVQLFAAPLHPPVPGGGSVGVGRGGSRGV